MVSKSGYMIAKFHLQIWIPIRIQEVIVFNLPAKGQLFLPSDNNLGSQLDDELQNKADNLITDMKKLESHCCVANFNVPS